MKFFILFAFLLLGVIGYKTYEQYNQIKDTQKLIIENESRTLAEFISAFRQTYQEILLGSYPIIDEHIIQLLPVHNTTEISKRFAKNLQDEIIIRTVSDRPRNIKNMANDFELEMIEYFKKNPKESYKFGKKEDQYFYSKPLFIKKSCLQCHGKREDTIAIIRDNYENSYDYKVGDIRGLLHIKIKNRGTFASLYSDFITTVMSSIFLYLGLLIIIYILIKKIHLKEEQHIQELKTEIQIKTYEIQKQKETFEILFEKSSDGITILGDDNRFIQCNEKIINMLHFNSKEELLNIEHPSKLSPEFQPDGRNSYEKAEEMISLAKKNNGHQFEWAHFKADGKDFLAEITLTPLTIDNRNIIYAVWRDISDRRKAQDELIEQKNILHHQAHHDALTGLPNRILFNDRLLDAIEKADHDATKLALFFIDLDEFKQINDSLGHEIGDRVLNMVAKRLKTKIRKQDTLARLGGDEFTIIMENYKKIEDVSSLAEKILNVLIEPIHIENQMLYISCSIGISLYPCNDIDSLHLCSAEGENCSNANPRDDIDSLHLLKYADAAMYKAKEEGKNNFQFYSAELTDLAYERIIMKSSLTQALKNEEFIVCYQPQVEGKNGKLLGMEALIRWQHPVMGLISPNEFIYLAEDSGLIVDIDRWVMKTAMNQVKRWYDEGLNPGVLALNLTLRHLQRDDFLEKLQEVMIEIAFKAQWLELEITEGEVMKKHEKVIAKLQVISDMGIGVAIDDFGTGYSSLSYLKRLPVNKLKIDRSFIKHIEEDAEDAAIVKAIISLAKILNLNIVAEGVETVNQKEFLLQNDCRIIQGFYFGRPMLAKKIKEKYFSSLDILS